MGDPVFIEALDPRVLLAAAPMGATVPPPDTSPPVVMRFNLNRLPKRDDLRVEFTLTYKDNVLMDRDSIDANDVVITGPRKFKANATPVKIQADLGGRRLKVTYRVDATSGPFATARSGVYSIALKKNQVKDTAGNAVAAKKYSLDVDLSLYRDLFAHLIP